MTLKMRHVVLSTMLSSFAFAAQAHDPRPGPNGGLKVDAGVWHAELVADGTPTVRIYLFDAEDRPLDPQGWSGNAILLVDGAAQRFDVAPDAAGHLTGTAAVSVPEGVTGAVRLTAPDGTAAQAKY
jgi:hypothetical protein